MARLSIPAWDRILFAPAHAVERIFFGLAEEDSPEWTLEKALKDLAMLKTIFDNGKVLKLPCVKTLLKIQDNVSFQNVKFNFVEKAKITICNNAVIWTDKVTGCVSVPRCVCVCVRVCVCVCVCVFTSIDCEGLICLYQLGITDVMLKTLICYAKSLHRYFRMQHLTFCN